MLSCSGAAKPRRAAHGAAQAPALGTKPRAPPRPRALNAGAAQRDTAPGGQHTASARHRCAPAQASLDELEALPPKRHPLGAAGAPPRPLEPGAAPAAEPGLQNEAGEYNCFLNVVVQCLWHCAAFREGLLRLPGDALAVRRRPARPRPAQARPAPERACPCLAGVLLLRPRAAWCNIRVLSVH